MMPRLLSCSSTRASAWTLALIVLAVFSCVPVTSHAHAAERTIKPVEPPTQLIEGGAGNRLVQVTDYIRADDGRNDYNVSGAGLTVAVLDTGLRTTHADFAGKVLTQRNYTNNNGGNINNAADGQGHGTNVGGIIVANGVHTGIAPGANIIPMKVLDNSGSGSFSAVNSALQWVLDNRQTYNITCVNMSLGADSNETSAPSSNDQTRQLIQQLRNARVAVCIAAGNSFYSFNSQQGMGYPATIPECVSVGAVYDSNAGSFSYGDGARAFSTTAGALTPFSQRLHGNVSSSVRTDIFAPGAPVTSAGINSDTGSSTQHGTSQATPVTAGVILLMQELYLRENGQLPTVDTIESYLRNNSYTVFDGDDEDDNVSNTNLTYFRVDVPAVLANVASPGPGPGPGAPSITQQPANQTVNEGQSATFSVAASGSGLSYQWQRNGQNLNGANASSYNTGATTLAMNGNQYRCVVSNSGGSVTSNSASLSVLSNPTPSDPEELTSGIGEFDSVTQGDWTDFYIEVPANATQLVVTTTGASSDVDLYVRKNSLPTLSAYDFRPYTYSGNESVTVNADSNPALSSGLWYCSVHGYSAGSFTITATLTLSSPPPPPPPPPSPNNPPVINAGPGANPNPALTGQPVSLSVSASDADGDALSYVWNFGNGSSTGGASMVRVYSTPGIYTVTVTVSDGEDSVSNSVQLTVNAPPNSAPVILSGPNANPNPAAPGQAVNFGVVADDDDGDPLSYTWTFGDGADGSGANTSHAYAQAGTYTASVTVSDGQDSVTDTVTVLVEVPDSLPLNVTKMVLKLNFKTSNRDQCIVKANLNVPGHVNVANAPAQVNIGGVVANFQLDSRGRAKTGAGNFSINASKGVLSVRLKKGNFKNLLADEGLVNATTSGLVQVRVRVTIDGQLFEDTVTLTYQAKAGKKGTAK